MSPSKGDGKWGFWPGKRLLLLILGSLGFWAHQPSLWPGERPVRGQHSLRLLFTARGAHGLFQEGVTQ